MVSRIRLNCRATVGCHLGWRAVETTSLDAGVLSQIRGRISRDLRVYLNQNSETLGDAEKVQRKGPTTDRQEAEKTLQHHS